VIALIAATEASLSIIADKNDGWHPRILPFPRILHARQQGCLFDCWGGIFVSYSTSNMWRYNYRNTDCIHRRDVMRMNTLFWSVSISLFAQLTRLMTR